jgi:DNA repair protein RadC
MSKRRVDVVEKRLQLAGAEALGETELVALVAGLAPREAASLLARLGGLERLMRAGLAELAEATGGEAAGRLKAALELGRRGQGPLDRGRPIACANDVYERLRGHMVALEQEELHVLGLDSLGRVVVHVVAARGTINQVFANARDVFRPLVREAAQSAIVAHNHPSGSHAPSDADQRLTDRLAEAGATLDVPLLDHVVVARSGRFSFAEEGRLNAT